MSRTLQNIITDSRNLINDVNSDAYFFTDDELTVYANQAVRFIAVACGWPFDTVNFQLEEGKAVYTLVSDAMRLKNAYFGDMSTKSEGKRLDILDEETMAERFPNWLNTHADNRGEPSRIFLSDRRGIFVHPIPNAANAVTGKKIWLTYVYYPATLVASGDTPDLPQVYHDDIQIYVAHLCQMGRLKNPTLGKGLLEDLIKKIELHKPKVTEQIEQKSFKWAGDYESGGGDSGIADLRLT